MFKGILSERNKILDVFTSLLLRPFKRRRCFIGWVLHIVISAVNADFAILHCLKHYVISPINSTRKLSCIFKQNLLWSAIPVDGG